MAFTVSELRSISFLLRNLDIPSLLPIPFWCDNKAALHIMANPVFNKRTKHLEIDCHLICDQFKLGFIAQVADLFTKSLTAVDFARFLPKLGLSSSAPA
ncbi:UNVERIFIED_CONTAM: hypothetical protein Sindi_2675800 [Sesamum indicum]